MTKQEKQDFEYVVCELLNLKSSLIHIIGRDPAAEEKLINITKRYNVEQLQDTQTKLEDILNAFHYDERGHCLFFTERESEIIAEYLIEQGVTINEEKSNS